MKVYIVEDNQNVREALAAYLKLEGLEVEEFEALAPAESAIRADSPDLIVLDVMLPDGDGFLFAKKLKQSADIPILFLTARDQESDRITGLELGADDYVVKPFSSREVVLRIKAILNRTAGAEDREERAVASYALDDDMLVVDGSTHRVEVNGSPVGLTAAEWNILVHLAEIAPRLLSRMQILEHSLGSIAEGSERTVDTHIKNIRRKLGREEWIETVRGFGYRFTGSAE